MKGGDARGLTPGRHVALLALTLLLLLVSAWLHDDAFITFRTVDNLLDGRGLVWNPAERVQAYTHPLWLFVLAAGAVFPVDLPTVALVASMLATLILVHLVATRVARGSVTALGAVALLLFSKAFLDYATSGLENPLTRLLLVSFVMLRLGAPGRPGRPGRRPFLGAVASGIALCRPDGILVVVPSLVDELRRGRERLGRTAAALALGFLPLLGWGLFAAFYYGSFVPNTALAKLGHGLPRPALVVQGLGYLLDSLVRDPITLVTIALATAVVVRSRRGDAVPLIVGAWLHLGWTVWIGGDHMSGRFLGLPFLAAVLALARHRVAPDAARRLAAPALAVLLLLLVPRGVGPLMTREIGLFGIANEIRGFHPSTGLIHRFRADRWPDHGWRNVGEAAAASAAAGGPVVRVTGAGGMQGYYGGPGVHWVERFALCDPLLARLPAQLPERTINRPRRVHWRPGHLERTIPAGYLESLERDANLLEDPALRVLYDRIRTVTRGDLADPGRAREALTLALGGRGGPDR